jgi:hypothetical protein
MYQIHVGKAKNNATLKNELIEIKKHKYELCMQNAL